MSCKGHRGPLPCARGKESSAVKQRTKTTTTTHGQTQEAKEGVVQGQSGKLATQDAILEEYEGKMQLLR